MKRTENINIGGALFYVDDDAFQILNDYIGKLERWFKDKEGGSDVVHDIELRLSEIFTGLTKGGELIVTQAMVREAIASVGQPEEFDGEAASDNNPPNLRSKRPAVSTAIVSTRSSVGFVPDWPPTSIWMSPLYASCLWFCPF